MGGPDDQELILGALVASAGATVASIGLLWWIFVRRTG